MTGRPSDRLSDPVRIAAHLVEGGVAIYPTETFYALGADPSSPAGVREVFRLKKRSPDAPLPWIAADEAQVREVCLLSGAAEELARKHWPGPLTLVLRRRDDPGTIAVRVSSHPLAREVARALGRPVISTSANRSGFPPATTAEAAVAAFPDAGIPILVLDAGVTPGGAPSTIVDATGESLRALRGRLP